MSALRKALLDEQFGPKPDSDAPAHLVAPGQTWPTNKPRCYKCHWWRSNKAHTGRCLLEMRGTGLMNSHDTMPGDGCRARYAPMWSKEDGLLERPSKID